MKEIIIYLTVSILLGLAIALIAGGNYNYVSKKPQQTEIQEVSSTDQLLIEIDKKLLNIEEAVSNITSTY